MSTRDRPLAPLGRLVLGLIVVIVFAAVPAPAQGTGEGSRISGSLPVGHWALQAVMRAEAGGLVDYLPARDAVPRSLVHRALLEARQTARSQGNPMLPLIDAWVERLEQEIPELRRPEGGGYRSDGMSLFGEYHTQSGAVMPGHWVDEPATGASPLDEDRTFGIGLSAAGGLGRRLAFVVQPELLDESVRLTAGEIVFGSPRLSISAARSPVGYGYGPDGIVLSGRKVFDRIQLETPTPFRLGGGLRRLGQFSLHTFVSRLDEPRHPGDPYFWGFAGQWRPHPRATVAIHRASIFGGDSVSTPTTLGNLARTFIGHNLLGFENEVVSASFRWRLPTEGWLPITVFGEWGAEDAAGAWRDVPGRRIGAYLPRLPGAPELAAGAEYASFAAACCGNPPWYRHAVHKGGWAQDEGPLGHALGGHGRQWLGFLHLDLHRSGLRVELEGFSRERLAENLYVPGREGESRGLSGSVGWRIHPRAEVDLGGGLESGDGWTQRSLRLGLVSFF